MKSDIAKQVIPFSLSSAQAPSSFRQSNLVTGGVSRISERVDYLAQGILEHVRIRSNIRETVKGKLSLGAKILQIGGLKKIFKQNFTTKEGEKLLKVSQCYLSTTDGPLAGLLYLSSDKVAFCSERSIKVCSPTGECVRVNYKVVIPLEKIMRASESENVKQPSRKYIVIVTRDNFEFWFMGFLNHRRTIRSIQKAVSQVQ